MKIFVLNLRGGVIGDSVKESSLFRYLKERYPDSKLVTTGNSVVKQLHLNNPDVDKLVHFPELDCLTQGVSKFRKMYSMLKSLVKSIRLARESDICILTQQKKYPYYWVPKFAGVPEIIRKEELPYKKYSCSMYLKNESVKGKIKSGKKKIAVNIESKDPDRCWPVKNYIQVIEVLIENGWSVHLLGVDRKYNKPIIQRFEKKIKNLVAKTSIRETALLLKNCDLYLGNDSGLTHIAAAVDTDSITILIDTDTDILNNPKKSTAKKLRKPTVKKVVEEVEKVLNES